MSEQIKTAVQPVIVFVFTAVVFFMLLKEYIITDQGNMPLWYLSKNQGLQVNLQMIKCDRKQVGVCMVCRLPGEPEKSSHF